jgi:membrane protein
MYNRPPMMDKVWLNLRRSFLRVIPACLTQAQAVAFNMFLAFFPVLLLAMGVLSSSPWMKEAAGELPSGFRAILPPGSHRLVTEFLWHHDPHPWKLIWFGLAGTLLVGTQVMIGLMEGFWIACGDCERPSFGVRYLRALVLLCLTIAPWLATVVLTVFGRQVRTWAIQQVGLPVLVRAVWTLFYYGATLLVAMLVLVVVYRIARPACRGWSRVVPGAVVATLLWWILNAGFGFYVRNMPYSVVYGSLAAVIGLMVWMYFTVLVVITGAAYNAEAGAQAALPVVGEQERRAVGFD